jgi:hypothetical protein
VISVSLDGINFVPVVEKDIAEEGDDTTTFPAPRATSA